jgi:methylmalonyl-CoA/ethylmalonyl-CoA epimerase
MKIDHFGFLTKDINKSILAFKCLGFSLSSMCSDEIRGVKIALMRSASCEMIELIMPINDNSVVSKIINSHNNNFYHICYQCKDLEQAINNLTKQGFLLIDKPKTAKALNNKKVAFMYSSSAGMIELLES